MKDFEICPGIVTKQTAYRIFIDDSRDVALYTPTALDILTKELNKESKVNLLLQTGKMSKQVGKCFTFFRFLDMLVEISLIAFSDPYISHSSNGGVPLILVEMTCLLLERMELSSGFSQIERKMHRTHTSR